MGLRGLGGVFSKEGSRLIFIGENKKIIDRLFYTKPPQTKSKTNSDSNTASVDSYRKIILCQIIIMEADYN